MTGYEKAYRSHHNVRRTARSLKMVLAYATMAALVLLSLPVWADEQSGGPPQQASAATVTNQAAPPTSFRNTPPPNAGGAVNQAPKIPIGKGGKGFSTPPPKPADNAKPAPAEAGNSDGDSEPVTLKVRRGNLEIDLVIPGEEKPSRGKSAKEAPLPPDDCRRPENKQKCKTMDESLAEEQERALSQRDAGEEVLERLKEARERTQSALGKAVDNVGRIHGMLDKFGASPKTSNSDVSDVGLVESDTLGTLD